MLSDGWEEGFSHLKQFSDRNGHCRVAQSDTTDDGYRLGSWVNHQRITKEKIGTDRRQRLEALPGWSWDPRSERWEDCFSQLKSFSECEKHCRVPFGYKTHDGYLLGNWVRRQRAAKDTMKPDRRQRLEALPGWSWDVLSDLWEEGFSHLRVFTEKEGHCRVFQKLQSDDGYRLGTWVVEQRQNKFGLGVVRQRRLEELPGWSWDIIADKWENGFVYLQDYIGREGHCLVPMSYKTNDAYRLGTWVGRQRESRDTMNSVRRQRLEALPGWSWAPRSERWDEGFSYLRQFSDSHGHCRVARSYKADDGYRLGEWVHTQRTKKNTMAPDRRQRLEALPGWAWKVEK